MPHRRNVGHTTSHDDQPYLAPQAATHSAHRAPPTDATAQLVPGDRDVSGGDAYDDDDDDDAQRRSDDDAEVVDEDDMAGPPTAAQRGVMPPPPRRGTATPQRRQRQDKTDYHHIGSPPSHRSDRTRTERGTPAPRRVRADPPFIMPKPARPAAQSSADPSMSDLLAAIQASRDAHSAEFATVVSQQRAQTEAIEDLSHRTEALEVSAASVSNATEALVERVLALETSSRPGSSTASSVPPSTASDPFRIDRSIMRITAKAMVAKPLMRAAGVARGQARLDGSTVGKSFTLRALPGGRRAPEETIRAILHARRLPSGEWRALAVRAPHGSSVVVFTDPDRSINQRRVGWHISAILWILRGKYPKAELVLAKAAGAVTCRWETVVCFDCNVATGGVDVSWCGEALALQVRQGRPGDRPRHADRVLRCRPPPAAREAFARPGTPLASHTGDRAAAHWAPAQCQRRAAPTGTPRRATTAQPPPAADTATQPPDAADYAAHPPRPDAKHHHSRRPGLRSALARGTHELCSPRTRSSSRPDGTRSRISSRRHKLYAFRRPMETSST